MSDIEPTFTGECQLAGWSDSHNGGAKVVLWLPDRDQLDVFAGLTARKGNTAGHRFMCVLVEIGDDEKPVEQGPKGGPLSRLAGLWCQEPMFQRWIVDVHGHSEGLAEQDDPRENSAILVRSLCEVESRADLDHNPEAKARFDQLIRIPYSAYRAQHAPQETIHA